MGVVVVLAAAERAMVTSSAAVRVVSPSAGGRSCGGHDVKGRHVVAKVGVGKVDLWR